MKIESVRGWAIPLDLRSVYEHEGPNATVPVLVVPLTPENIKALREDVARTIQECFHSKQGSDFCQGDFETRIDALRKISEWGVNEILTAIDITQHMGIPV